MDSGHKIWEATISSLTSNFQCWNGEWRGEEILSNLNDVDELSVQTSGRKIFIHKWRRREPLCPSADNQIFENDPQAAVADLFINTRQCMQQEMKNSRACLICDRYFRCNWRCFLD